MTTVDLDLDHERRRLFGLAYRMIGEVAEAEDAVQDAASAFARPAPPGTSTRCWRCWHLT